MYCIYKNKTELLNKVSELDFKANKEKAIERFYEIITKCYKCCADNKCSAYRNFVYYVAQKYKESK